MSETCRWRRGERYETCVDDGVRGSAPKQCMAYSRALCLPSSPQTPCPWAAARAHSPHRWISPGCRSGRGFSRGKTRRTIFDSFVNRVDRDDISGRGIIDPIDPAQADEPLAIALAEGHRNAAVP